MPWVYMLRSSSGRHYIGSKIDLERQIEQHRKGHAHSTARMGELTLLASLEVATLAEARELERELKWKKNPKLALHLLEQRKDKLSG